MIKRYLDSGKGPQGIKGWDQSAERLTSLPHPKSKGQEVVMAAKKINKKQQQKIFVIPLEISDGYFCGFSWSSV